MVHSLAHQPIGIFGDHDTAVDEHPQRQQHAEHHHKVEGISQQINDGDGKQQRKRNAEPDDKAAPEPHGRHYEDHDQRQCGEDIALQLSHLHCRKFGLILRGNNADTTG